MMHFFDTDIAKQYGVHAAIILHNIHFWIEKNRANEKHYYDGTYWTYNTTKAFTKMFPYMTARQINYALQKLKDEDIIITGNYNKSSYDRTMWYALTIKGLCILQFCKMEVTKTENGIDENVKSTNTYNKNSYLYKDIISRAQEDPESVKRQADIIARINKKIEKENKELLKKISLETTEEDKKKKFDELFDAAVKHSYENINAEVPENDKTKQ